MKNPFALGWYLVAFSVCLRLVGGFKFTFGGTILRSSSITTSTTTTTTTTNVGKVDSLVDDSRRRGILSAAPGIILASFLHPLPSSASPSPFPSPDPRVPKNKYYEQYKATLSLSADYYYYRLGPSLASPDDWEDVSTLFTSMQGRSGGQPSWIERNFANPMRIVASGMDDPQATEDLNEARDEFERSMAMIREKVKGSKRDLPVDTPDSDVVQVKKAYDDGLRAVNKFFLVLNRESGTKEMKYLPGKGEEYSRSEKLFRNYEKKVKSCQNR